MDTSLLWSPAIDTVMKRDLSLPPLSAITHLLTHEPSRHNDFDST